jgi:hypothetical protein
MKKFRPTISLLLLLAFILLLFQGCVGSDGAKPLSEMTSKEKVIVMYGTYNSQYNDYMRVMGYTKDDIGTWRQTSQPVLTASQLNILQKKKAILKQVYPLMSLYGSYVESGRVPSPQVEREVFQLLDSLALLAPD